MENNQNHTQNKQAIRNLYENIMNNREFDSLNGLVSDQYISVSGTKGYIGFQEQLSAVIKAFPDADWKIEEIIGEGDKVFVKQHFKGTHKAEFQHIPATEKVVSNIGTSFYEFEDGKIVSSEIRMDRLSFFQQLGLIPFDLTSL